jgi:hypothetical protein
MVASPSKFSERPFNQEFPFFTPQKEWYVKLASLFPEASAFSAIIELIEGKFGSGDGYLFLSEFGIGFDLQRCAFHVNGVPVIFNSNVSLEENQKILGASFQRELRIENPERLVSALLSAWISYPFLMPVALAQHIEETRPRGSPFQFGSPAGISANILMGEDGQLSVEFFSGLKITQTEPDIKTTVFPGGIKVICDFVPYASIPRRTLAALSLEALDHVMLNGYAFRLRAVAFSHQILMDVFSEGLFDLHKAFNQDEIRQFKGLPTLCEAIPKVCQAFQSYAKTLSQEEVLAPILETMQKSLQNPVGCFDAIVAGICSCARMLGFEAEVLVQNLGDAVRKQSGIEEMIEAANDACTALISKCEEGISLSSVGSMGSLIDSAEPSLPGSATITPSPEGEKKTVGNFLRGLFGHSHSHIDESGITKVVSHSQGL